MNMVVALFATQMVRLKKLSHPGFKKKKSHPGFKKKITLGI